MARRTGGGIIGSRPSRPESDTVSGLVFKTRDPVGRAGLNSTISLDVA